MAYRTTEADLLSFCRSKLLASADSPGVRAQRINLRLGTTGIPRDLALANHLMSQDWRDFAIEPVEEVLYWMGECVALMYGCKVTPEADGHRWKALRISGMYCEAFLPSVAPLASLFKPIGDVRNNRKYDEEPVDTEIVAKYLSAVTRVWAAFEPDFRRRAAQRRTI